MNCSIVLGHEIYITKDVENANENSGKAAQIMNRDEMLFLHWPWI